MADDKGGSDLDVFEGLSKKGRSGAQRREQLPIAPATLRGGMGVPPPTPGPTSRPLPPPPSQGPTSRPLAGPASRPLPPPASRGPVSRPLPPPSKVPTRGKTASMPGPEPTPSAPVPSVPLAVAPPPSGPAVLPKPTPPPSRRATSTPPPAADAIRTPRFSEAPAIAVRDEEVLPGTATADLDWDDEEESTHVFADSPELYGEMQQQRGRAGADDTGKRDVGAAAALLKGSGRAAAPVPIITPVPHPVAPIPAPAPVPREAGTTLPTPKIPPPPRSAEPSWQHAPSTSKGRGPLPYIVAALAVIGLIVAVFLFLRGEGKSAGALQIDVVYQGAPVDVAEIFIEGQRRCDNTPCTVKDLKPGKYTVKVTTRDQGSRLVDVEIVSGVATPITVDLGSQPVGPDKTASVSPPPKTGPATIKLTSKYDGVKLIVDGVEKTTLSKGQTYSVGDLKPGTVKLRFVGPAEYAAKELALDVAAGETKEVDIVLTLLQVRVTFVLETADAKVTLTSDDDNKSETLEWKKGEKELERSLDSSKRWTVAATKKGFIELKQSIVFDEDSPTKTVKIALTKAGEEPPPVVASATTVTPPASSSAPPPPPPSSKATLSMNSIPPSKVLLDGRPLGNTPASAQVDPGSHTVTFIHKTRGRKQRSVTVSAGQTKVVSVTFKESEGG